ncbi:MAG TPA: helix-turn-helix domain-containing protein [Opitutaceae bacterium]|jgi:transcriptional regulator with XRE-family HTH domain
MKIEPQTSDASILEEIGRRLRASRLGRNLTQQGLATESGVAKRTVERIEAGELATAISSYVRVCRALGILARFEMLLPLPPPSPIEQLKLHGKARRRASGSRARGKQEKPKDWSWGDS